MKIQVHTQLNLNSFLLTFQRFVVLSVGSFFKRIMPRSYKGHSRFIASLLVFILLVFCSNHIEAQGNSDSANSDAAIEAQMEKTNNSATLPMPTFVQKEQMKREEAFAYLESYNKAKFLKSNEFAIGVITVLLCVFLISIQAYLFVRGFIKPEKIAEIMLLTIIIFATLFLIAVGYSNDQIAPAMGLLGTIAGYLLGKPTTSIISPTQQKTNE